MEKYTKIQAQDRLSITCSLSPESTSITVSRTFVITYQSRRFQAIIYNDITLRRKNWGCTR